MIVWMRSLLAVVAGLLSAFVIVHIGESIGHAVFPVPPGVDLSSHDAIAAAIKDSGIPTGTMASVVVAWAIGALAGGWIAALSASRARVAHALVLGALLLTATVTLLLHIPHPVWMWIAGIVLILPAAYVGGRLALPWVRTRSCEPTPS